MKTIGEIVEEGNSIFEREPVGTFLFKTFFYLQAFLPIFIQVTAVTTALLPETSKRIVVTNKNDLITRTESLQFKRINFNKMEKTY